MRNRSPLYNVALALLVISTVVILALNLPPSWQYADLALLYVILTALALRFGVQLAVGRIGPAHIIGVIAFLSLPRDAVPMMTWAIALGGALGGLLIILLQRELRGWVLLRAWLYIVARVVISFTLAEQLYFALGRPLPLVADPDQIVPDSIALTMYGLAYVLIYFGIYALQSQHEERSMQLNIRQSWLELMVTLALPVPFAVLAAQIYTAQELTRAAFGLLVIGLMAAIFGLYRLTNAQHQLRRQLDELRTLAVVTQAMRSHLNLDALLNTVYLQVADLLDISNFTLALYDRFNTALHYPLAFKDGERRVLPSDHKDPLLEQVLETQAPLLLPDGTGSAEAERKGLTLPPGASWLGVPLLAGGRTLGAIVVVDYGKLFTTDHLRLLNIVAASASIAIENAQLYEQQTERVSQLADLNTISFLLSGTLSRDTVLDTVISSASTVADATGVAVYMFWDDTMQVLALVRSAGLDDSFTDDPPEPLIMTTRSTNANGTLMTLQQTPPVVIKDAATDKRVDEKLRKSMEKVGKAAWVELPLSVGATDLGVLIVYYNTPQPFPGEMVELLRTFATQVGQAINNARLYGITDAALEQRVEQLYALAAMGRLLTATMEINSIADIMLSYAADATKSPAGVVILRDEESGGMRVLSQRGYPDGSLTNRNIIEQSLTARALREGQIIRLNDLSSDSGYVSVAPGMRAQLTVPILRGKQVLGAVTLESDGSYTDEDENFISQITNQAVIALDNARLFRQITEAFNRLQVILNTMEEGIVLVDGEGRVVLANPRVDLIGLRPGALLGFTMEELITTNSDGLAERVGFKDAAEFKALMQQLGQPQEQVDIPALHYSVKGELGTIYVSRQVIPIRDKDDALGALLVFYDETEEKELAQQREDLSRMIVHDLRSPLSAVTTSLKLMREFVPKDAEFRPMMEMTTDASQRAIRKLLSRVDSLLDVSKMQSGELHLNTEPTELATLADSVCAELSSIAQELDVTLTTQVPEHLPLLDVDGDKIERLLLNLVDNALKYTNRETQVIIRAHMPDAEGRVRVEVADHGPGVPEDYKQRLFDRYVQIKGRRSARGGVGLGLTFCRLVVEAHGGSIWIEDNQPNGSIFAFTLPALKQEAVAE